MLRLLLIGIALAGVVGVSIVAALPDSGETAPRAPRLNLDCTRYASLDGSDGGAGTRASPFRTPQRLVDSLTAGETGCLRGGDYASVDDEGNALSFRRAGRPGAPITIGSAPGERARLIGTVVVAGGADHVRIAGVDIEGAGGQNTVKVYAADTVIEANAITNEQRGDSCLILGSSEGGPALRPVILGNVFHDCGAPSNENLDHGIYAAIVEGARIVDNVFYNPAATSIQLYPDAQASYVAGNVIDGGPDTVRGGIVIGGDDASASSDNVVERNVISHTATHSVYSFWEDEVGDGNAVRGNCTWDAGEQPAILDDGGLVVEGNLTADPRFRDRDERDYRLADDSPCLTVLGP